MINHDVIEKTFSIFVTKIIKQLVFRRRINDTKLTNISYCRIENRNELNIVFVVS